MIAGNYNGAVLSLGSCQYSGSVHNKFEVFKSVIDGNNVYQLKDSEAFENKRPAPLPRPILLDQLAGDGLLQRVHQYVQFVLGRDRLVTDR